MGQKWVKTPFSKMDLGPFGMLKQVKWALVERVLTQFSPLRHMYAPVAPFAHILEPCCAAT